MDINTKTQQEAYKKRKQTDIQDVQERLAKMEEMLWSIKRSVAALAELTTRKGVTNGK